ncbi:MAG: XrtA system polysaccharide deacetylase, partial [Methanobacteriota archaeon]
MPPLNALTVDVEDWFHLFGAGESLSRDKWDALPSRVERNTERLLSLFDAVGAKGTFFFLGWVAERHPKL